MWEIIEICKENMLCIYEIFGVYCLWISLFYMASYLHTYYCTPKGLFGFLSTPFLIQAPHCVAFRWIISTGTTNINIFWGLLAGFFMRKLKITRTNL